MDAEENPPPPGQTSSGARRSAHRDGYDAPKEPVYALGMTKVQLLLGVIGLLVLVIFIMLIIMSSRGSNDAVCPSSPSSSTTEAPQASAASGSGGILTTVPAPPPGTTDGNTSCDSTSALAQYLAGSFTNETASAQFQKQFLDGVSASKIDALVREYSFLPHIAGSERNTLLATKTAQRLREWGFDDVREEKIPALLMKIGHRSVNLTDASSGDVKYQCVLAETNVVNQSDWDKALPPTNGYTGEGLVQNAKLVWANYGRASDFEAIADVNLTGTVVMMRYGKIFRGNKVDQAAQRGAVGVIITYDPFDVARGAAFPDGPWASNVTTQRGSVALNEGDPRTPSWPSQYGGPMLSEAQLFDRSEMQSGPLPSIPVQPMGYGDATKLLEGQLNGGNPLPAGWTDTGFINFFANGIGPGPATISMEVRRQLKEFELTNVVGTIEGAVEPDRTISIGSHRDAWTYGAVDPISGHSTTMEIARNLGKLYGDGGWRPRRSIQVCSWDAEEWALIGSVEYVETTVELLRQRGVVYLNLDIAVDGTEVMEISGSPSVLPIVHEVAKQVPHPSANTDGTSTASKTLDDIMEPLEAPGSGSDHLGFIQLAGNTIIDATITNRTDAYQSVYHSNYDSYYWSSRFGDPGFKYHAAMAQFYGLLAMRFADDNVLPFSVPDYASNVSDWVDDYKTADNLAMGVNFGFIDNATTKFITAAAQHKKRVDAIRSKLAVTSQTTALPRTALSTLPSQAELRAVNDIQMGLERVWLGYGARETGSDWFKHVLFTPSKVNSYASTVMPLIGDALATDNATAANFAIGRIAQFIYRAALFVNSSKVSPPNGRYGW